MTELTNEEKFQYCIKIDDLLREVRQKIEKKHTRNAVMKYRKQVRDAIESGSLTLRPEEDFNGGQLFSGKASPEDSILIYFRINSHDFEPRINKKAIKRDFKGFRDKANYLESVLSTKSKGEINTLFETFKRDVKRYNYT